MYFREHEAEEVPGMQKAELTDKNIIVDILVQSFSDNKSINYIVKQDSRREA